MIISRRVVGEIRRALEAAYPREGCGLLLGEMDDQVRVRRHIVAQNRRVEDRAAERRYLIDPQDFRDIAQAAHQEGLEIVGVYHSHPEVPPEPSAYDREHAWPWYHYLIVSVVRGTAQEMRVWQLTEDRAAFVERTVDILNSGEGR